VKWHKAKVRIVYNKGKLGERYQVELKRVPKELLAARKTAQETFLQSVPQNEGNCWSEFYKNVNRQEGNREIIPALNDQNRAIITDSTGDTNILNSYYSSVFCCDHNIQKVQLANWGETFITNNKIIRKI